MLEFSESDAAPIHICITDGMLFGSTGLSSPLICACTAMRRFDASSWFLIIGSRCASKLPPNWDEITSVASKTVGGIGLYDVECGTIVDLNDCRDDVLPGYRLPRLQAWQHMLHVTSSLFGLGDCNPMTNQSTSLYPYDLQSVTYDVPYCPLISFLDRRLRDGFLPSRFVYDGPSGEDADRRLVELELQFLFSSFVTVVYRVSLHDRNAKVFADEKKFKKREEELAALPSRNVRKRAKKQAPRRCYVEIVALVSSTLESLTFSHTNPAVKGFFSALQESDAVFLYIHRLFQSIVNGEGLRGRDVSDPLSRGFAVSNQGVSGHSKHTVPELKAEASSDVEFVCRLGELSVRELERHFSVEELEILVPYAMLSDSAGVISVTKEVVFARAFNIVLMASRSWGASFSSDAVFVWAERKNSASVHASPAADVSAQDDGEFERLDQSRTASSAMLYVQKESESNLIRLRFLYFSVNATDRVYLRSSFLDLLRVSADRNFRFTIIHHPRISLVLRAMNKNRVDRQTSIAVHSRPGNVARAVPSWFSLRSLCVASIMRQAHFRWALSHSGLWQTLFDTFVGYLSSRGGHLLFEDRNSSVFVFEFQTNKGHEEDNRFLFLFVAVYFSKSGSFGIDLWMDSFTGEWEIPAVLNLGFECGSTEVLWDVVCSKFSSILQNILTAFYSYLYVIDKSADGSFKKSVSKLQSRLAQQEPSGRHSRYQSLAFSKLMGLEFSLKTICLPYNLTELRFEMLSIPVVTRGAYNALVNADITACCVALNNAIVAFLSSVLSVCADVSILTSDDEDDNVFLLCPQVEHSTSPFGRTLSAVAADRINLSRASLFTACGRGAFQCFAVVISSSYFLILVVPFVSVAAHGLPSAAISSVVLQGISLSTTEGVWTVDADLRSSSGAENLNNAFETVGTMSVFHCHDPTQYLSSEEILLRDAFLSRLTSLVTAFRSLVACRALQHGIGLTSDVVDRVISTLPSFSTSFDVSEYFRICSNLSDPAGAYSPLSHTETERELFSAVSSLFFQCSTSPQIWVPHAAGIETEMPSSELLTSPYFLRFSLFASGEEPLKEILVLPGMPLSPFQDVLSGDRSIRFQIEAITVYRTLDEVLKCFLNASSSLECRQQAFHSFLTSDVEATRHNNNSQWSDGWTTSTTSVSKRIFALFSRQVLAGLLLRKQLTRSLLDQVRSFLSTLPAELKVELDQPLTFVDAAEGRSLFFEELEKFDMLTLVKVDEVYVVMDVKNHGDVSRSSSIFSAADASSDFSSFWCFIQVHFSTVRISIFHPRISPGHVLVSELLDNICYWIGSLNHRSNQLILLSQLHDSRLCSDLLLPPSKFDIVSDDEDAFSVDRSFYDDDIASEQAIQTFFAVPPSHHPGMFRCPLVHSLSFVVPFRLSFSQLAVQNLISSIFLAFSVSNRKNLFVYRDSFGHIFYMRLCLSKAHDSTKFRRDNSLAESDSSLLLLVFGIDPPSTDITYKLHDLVVSKIASMALSSLSTLIARNPNLKMQQNDLDFLRNHPSRKDSTSFVLLPQFLHPLQDFFSILRQELLSRSFQPINGYNGADLLCIPVVDSYYVNGVPFVFQDFTFLLNGVDQPSYRSSAIPAKIPMPSSKGLALIYIHPCVSTGNEVVYPSKLDSQTTDFDFKEVLEFADLRKLHMARFVDSYAGFPNDSRILRADVLSAGDFDHKGILVSLLVVVQHALIRAVIRRFVESFDSDTLSHDHFMKLKYVLDFAVDVQCSTVSFSKMDSFLPPSSMAGCCVNVCQFASSLGFRFRCLATVARHLSNLDEICDPAADCRFLVFEVMESKRHQQSGFLFVCLRPSAIELHGFHCSASLFDSFWHSLCSISVWSVCRSHVIHSVVHAKIGLKKHSSTRNVISCMSSSDASFSVGQSLLLWQSATPPSVARVMNPGFSLAISPDQISQMNRSIFEVLDGRFCSPSAIEGGNEHHIRQLQLLFSGMESMESRMQKSSLSSDWELLRFGLQQSVPTACFRSPLFTQGRVASGTRVVHLDEERLDKFVGIHFDEDEYLRVRRTVLLHRNVLDRFIARYSAYIQQHLGFSPFVCSSPHYFGHPDAYQGSTCISLRSPVGLVSVSLIPNAAYFYQVFPDQGCCFIELGFRASDIFVNVFVRHPISSISPSATDFSDKLSRLIRALHLRSFAYDFQVRLFEEQLLRPDPALPLFDCVDCLRRMLDFYSGIVPRYARNGITTTRISMPLKGQTGGQEFFSYLLENSDRYGLQSVGDCLLFVQDSCAVVASCSEPAESKGAGEPMATNSLLHLDLLILVVASIKEYTPQVDIAPEKAEALLRATVRTIENNLQVQFAEAISIAEEHRVLDGLWEALSAGSLGIDGLMMLCTKAERTALESIDESLTQLMDTSVTHSLLKSVTNEFGGFITVFDDVSVCIIRHPTQSNVFFATNFSDSPSLVSSNIKPGIYKRARVGHQHFPFTETDKMFVEYIAEGFARACIEHCLS
eukprot:ANDGO_07181.mRNA.1 hypothetical protein NAEGRDRAFT_58984